MKIIAIDQDPLEVSGEEAQAIMTSLELGVKYVIVRNEYIKASVIIGIRNDENDYMPRSAWGSLPAGQMQHFFDDKRDEHGKGWERFQSMRRKLGV